MRLILASGSPRRRELLKRLRDAFEVMSPDIEENFNSELEEIGAQVSDLAMRKALAIADGLGDPAWVIGADTIVYCRGEKLGKPRDAVDAARMLRALADGWHEVITGVAVVRAAGEKPENYQGHAVSRVCMRALEPAEIAAYIAGGEPMDKAGAYAIQGEAAGFITEIQGSYENIVGLPLELTAELLQQAGV